MLHPFFKDLDMEALLKKTIAAPFIPTVQDPNDLRHFDKEVT